MLPECTYITQIIQHFHDILNYSDPQRFAAYAINELTLTEMYRAMVSSMVSTAQSHFKNMDYSCLILKDPELTNFVDMIPRFFGEDSKIICVIRDPRSVIASMVEVERKKDKILWRAWIKKPGFIATKDLVIQLSRFKKLISNIFIYYWKIHGSMLYKQNGVHIVRYEKIVAHDEDEFRRLENYLGFDVDREGIGKAYFCFDRADPTYSPGYGKPIASIGSDFNNRLKRSEIKKIESAFSGMNAIYGWWS